MAVVDFNGLTNAACLVIDPVADLGSVNTFSGSGNDVSNDLKLPVPCDIYVAANASNGSIQIQGDVHSGTASFSAPEMDFTVADTDNNPGIAKASLTSANLYFTLKLIAGAAADLDKFILFAIAKFAEGKGYHEANAAWMAFTEATGGSADWAQS